MRSSTTSMILVGLIAALAPALEGFAQIPELRRSSPNEVPRWTIDHITGGVYRATANNSGTVFLVTPAGIILADPLNPEFSMWLRQEFATRFGVPVRYVVYSHYHWDHMSISGVMRNSTTADRNSRLEAAINQGFTQSPYLDQTK